MLRALIVVILVLLSALPRPSGTNRPPAVAWEPDSVPDAFARPAAALAWPGATRGILVDSDGALYNGVWRLDVTASVDGSRARPPHTIAFEERWRPIAHWTERAGDVRWDFEAVALPAPEAAFAAWSRDAAAWRTLREARAARERRRHGKPEPVLRADADDGAVPLVVSVLATARNDGSQARRVALDLALLPARADEAWYDGGAWQPVPRWSWCAPGADTALAWSEMRTSGRTSRREALLAPGARLSIHFVAASHPLPAARLAAWSRIPHATRTREAREWWAHEVERGTRFRLNDPEVEAAVRAARVVLLECRERRDGHWVALAGPCRDRNARIADGARSIAAFATQGYGREARELAESVLERQQERGAFTDGGSPAAETGPALWALAQAGLRPAPAPELAEYADAACDAWRWCERQRRAYAALPGLLSGADTSRAAGGALVGTDGWALAGYTAAERLLRAAGREGDADRVAASHVAYRLAVARAIAHTGSADVPASYAGNADDAGNLELGYPCDALPATHPRLAALARRYWAETRHSLGFRGSADSLHGYLAADLATWALRTGRRADADAALDALLAWRDATGGGCERFSPAGDYGAYLPPNARSAAALLQLVRNGLVDDDGDQLVLTQGARARWWRGGQLDGAPTRWGTLSVRFERVEGLARWRWTPVPAWTQLVLPPGTRLATELKAPLAQGARPDVVLAPPGTVQAQVEVEPAPPSRTSPPRVFVANEKGPLRDEGAPLEAATRPPASRVGAKRAHRR